MILQSYYDLGSLQGEVFMKQQGHQHRFMRGFFAGNGIQDRTDQTQKAHIQEGCRKATDEECVCGCQGRLGENAPETD